jgi:hypothetical protein
MARRFQLVRFLLISAIAMAVIVVLYFADVGIDLLLLANSPAHS